MIKVALLITTLLVAVAPTSAETLREAVAQAYATNPQLLAARARQEALEEQPEQAGAAGRLTAAATGGGGYDRLGYGRAAFATASVALPIWTGGRVQSAVRAADRDVAAGAQGLDDRNRFALRIEHGGQRYVRRAAADERIAQPCRQAAEAAAEARKIPGMAG